MSKEFEAWISKWAEISPGGARRYAEKYPEVQAAFTAGRALGRREMKGEAILVPHNPEPARLESMCVRYDHGFHLKRHIFLKDLGGFRDETDEEFERRKEATRTTMRQLYEEATGQGFYQPAAAIEAIPEEV